MRELVRQMRLTDEDVELLEELFLSFHRSDQLAWALHRMRQALADYDNLTADDLHTYRGIVALQLLCNDAIRDSQQGGAMQGETTTRASKEKLSSVGQLMTRIQSALDSMGLTRAQRQVRESEESPAAAIPRLIRRAEKIVRERPEAFTFKCCQCGSLQVVMVPTGSFPCPHCKETIPAEGRPHWALQGMRGHPWNPDLIELVLKRKIHLGDAAKVLQTSREALVRSAEKYMGPQRAEVLGKMMDIEDPPVVIGSENAVEKA